jgi:hypothetical protein
MLKDFGGRMTEHILFLRHVTSIKISVWRDKEPQPQLLHLCRVGNDGGDFRRR